MCDAYCLQRGVRKGSEEQGSTEAGPHAGMRGGDDVAESPMEMLTQTFMSGKELVWISLP